MSTEGIPLTGFKDCDIRGEFGVEVNGALAYRFGHVVGSVTQERRVVVGGDFRRSTPELMRELKRGLVDSGVVVYDLGQVSTPSFYFARRHLGIKAGIMVTASHSPSAYNGFKPVLGDLPITPEELEELKRLTLKGSFPPAQGRIEKTEIKQEYVRWLAARFAGLSDKVPKVVFDCGNGATGWVIRDVLNALDIRAEVLFEEPDGDFPNRSPDIAGPEDLAKLEQEVVGKEAGLGAGFDGDGDRVGFVDEHGRRVPSDLLIAWLSRELLKKSPNGKVVYDLKLSKVVPETVNRSGGEAIVQKSGHTFIKRTMLDSGAILGGEYTGHLFYKELDGGDDGLFSALLVCSLIAESKRSFSELLSDLPRYWSTPDLRIKYPGGKKELIRKVRAMAKDQGAEIVLVDGVKAEYKDGWALMRASVTEPAFTFRFEGNTKTEMLNVAKRFLSGLGPLGDEVWKKILDHESSHPKV
jgi:phosphomannomutase / phosphoglucomutase